MSDNQRHADTGRTTGLRAKVAHGLGWLIGTSVYLQLFSLVTQLLLGWWLSADDFGIYALAASCTVLLQVFRDGGVQLWLARQNPDEFRSHVPAAFWLSTFASLLVGAALCLVAPLAGHIYATTDVTRLIILLGLATPIQALSVIPDAGLQVEMRFRDLALVRTVGASFRYGLTIVLALWGFGPYSFVLPLFAAGLAQALVSFSKMNFHPGRFRFCLASSKAVLGGSFWAMIGALASAAFRQIDYLLLGLFAPVGVVGVYFFAYQLSIQPGLLVSENIRKVLIPAFSAARGDKDRQVRAVVQTAWFLGLVASPLIIYFALICGSVESVLWKGRWAAAVPAIRFLSLAMPIHLFSLFTHTLIQSAGAYRFWSASTAIRGTSIGLAVLASSFFGGQHDASVVAAFVATTLATSGIVESILMLRRLHLPVGKSLRAFIAPYAVTIAAAVCAWNFSAREGPEALRLVATSIIFFTVTAIGFATLFRPRLVQLFTVAQGLLPRHASYE